MSVDVDVCPTWLAPFTLSSSDAAPETRRTATTGSPTLPTYDGPGIVGGGLRRIESRRSSDRFILSVEGTPRAEIARAGDWIESLGSRPGELEAFELEILFGPALILALASHGVFCLHASAVRVGEVAVAFIGPSGAGKSTLAREIERLGRPRLADDILPVTVSADGVLALPQFPHMKLATEAQYGADRPERVPLGSIYDIGQEQPAAGLGMDSCLVESRPLPPREAFLRVLRCTVAARLFDRALAGRHMEFCDAVASRVPVRELGYARSLTTLPSVSSVIELEMGAAAEGRSPARR